MPLRMSALLIMFAAAVGMYASVRVWQRDPYWVWSMHPASVMPLSDRISALAVCAILALAFVVIAAGMRRQFGSTAAAAMALVVCAFAAWLAIALIEYRSPDHNWILVGLGFYLALLGFGVTAAIRLKARWPLLIIAASVLLTVQCVLDIGVSNEWWEGTWIYWIYLVCHIWLILLFVSGIGLYRAALRLR